MATAGSEGANDHEKDVINENKKPRWTGRGDQRRGRSYNNQRGQNRRNYNRYNEHDVRSASGDGRRGNEKEGTDDGLKRRPERRDQDHSDEKHMSYRRDRQFRSNQNANYHRHSEHDDESASGNNRRGNEMERTDDGVNKRSERDHPREKHMSYKRDKDSRSNRHNEHDDRSVSHDIRRDNETERRDDGVNKRSDRYDQDHSGEKQMSYRRDRHFRSNQDTNWRDPSSNKPEKTDHHESSSTGSRSDTGRRKHPDKQIYRPRGAQSQNQEDTSESNKSSYGNSRPRRTDDRSGYRGGRSHFQGEPRNRRVIEREKRPDSVSEDGEREYKSRDRRGSKDDNTKNKHDSGKPKEELWEDELMELNQTKEDQKSEQRNQRRGGNKAEARQTRTDNRRGYRAEREHRERQNRRVIERERRPDKMEDNSKDYDHQVRRGSTEELWGEGNDKMDLKDDKQPYGSQNSEHQSQKVTSKYVDKNSVVIASRGSKNLPALRTSPTMGLDQYPHKDKNKAECTTEDRYDESPTYSDAPIGVNAFGLYQDPYGMQHPPGDIDGATAMQYAGEVSIGRGTQWNEWYHNLWHGPDQRDAGRGFQQVKILSGGGSRGGHSYQKRPGAKQGRNTPVDDFSDVPESKQKKSGTNVYAEEFHPKNFTLPTPGFIKKGEDKSKSASSKKPPKKPRTGKMFSGSNETQTGNMIEQLTEGTYECLVCCDVVKCEARVWSCASCYTVFHLKCAKEWAKSPAAAAEDSDGWKCPACRNVVVHIPYVYKCFCGKSRDPPWEPGDTPHSCGEVCKRKRTSANCNHPCNILCHPGPCPQCPASIKRSCVCGKTKQTVRCGAVPVLRCQKACNKLLNCAIHVCEKVCHEDKCDECQIKISQECFCGKDKREIVCGSSPDAEEGAQKFSCGQPCGRDLDCGNHTCKDPCHLGDCDPCPLTPDAVKTCPCGQTTLDKLLEFGDQKERTECTDPIPTCQKTCGKPLLCGGDNIHTCQMQCHEGDCGPCDGTSMVRCRCGHRFIDIPCDKISKDTANAEHMCDRKCTKRKSCGKHKCQQKCCIDSSHLCTQMCGRKLNCGVHICENQCHAGNCIRCLEASFEELFCHCGASVLMPPIPCGTKPPECNQQCVRRHKCDHTVRHTCHSEEECPPCAELTSKTCMGGHEFYGEKEYSRTNNVCEFACNNVQRLKFPKNQIKLRHNLPCYIEEVSCGKSCGRPLPCRQHTCQKTCHRGFCGSECIQPCPKPRTGCGHPCGAPCHPDTQCPKGIRCKAKVTIKCACGNLSETSQCYQGVDDSQLTEAFQKMTTSAVAAQLKFGQSSVDISKLMAFRDDKGQRILECTEECARLERIRNLRDALHINDPDLTGSAPNYIPWLKEQAKKNPTFVSSVEKDFAAVVNAVKTKYTSRTHAFSPMHRDQRRTIHELSDFYGLESQSYDQEPKRNVVVTARRDKCYVPSVTLTSAVQQELHPKAPTPISHSNSKLSTNKMEVLKPKSRASKVGAAALEKKKSEEEVIDYFDMT